MRDAAARLGLAVLAISVAVGLAREGAYWWIAVFVGASVVAPALAGLNRWWAWVPAVPAILFAVVVLGWTFGCRVDQHACL